MLYLFIYLIAVFYLLIPIFENSKFQIQGKNKLFFNAELYFYK